MGHSAVPACARPKTRRKRKAAARLMRPNGIPPQRRRSTRGGAPSRAAGPRGIFPPTNGQLLRHERIARTMEKDAAPPRLTTSDRVYGGIALAAVLLALW